MLSNYRKNSGQIDEQMCINDHAVNVAKPTLFIKTGGEPESYRWRWS